MYEAKFLIMWSDDFDEGEFNSESVNHLLSAFRSMKNGGSMDLLEEEDYQFLTDYFLRRGEFDDAITACEMGLTYYPFSASMVMLKADVLSQKGHLNEALAALDQAEDMGGRDVTTLLIRSDIFLAQLRIKKAIELLEGALDELSGEDKVEVLMELVDVYEWDENYDGVFYALVKVLETDPNHVEALNNIDFWADFVGHQEESIRLHLQILDRDPFKAQAWFNLGAAYHSLNKKAEAIDAYAYCLALDDRLDKGYPRLIELYLKQKNYEEAIAILKDRLNETTAEEWVLESLALCYEKKGDLVTARDFYHQVIAVNPLNDQAFYKMGQGYFKEKNWEQAAKALSKALTLDKDNYLTQRALGLCLIEMDAGVEAISFLSNAVRQKSNNKTNWMALMKALYHFECYSELLDSVSIGLETLGEKAEFYCYRALALFKLGQRQEALLQLENGLEINPRKWRLLLDLEPDLLQRNSVNRLIAKYKKN